ncbi:hypothetical protein Taro_035781 [Colocasia esculenta]|uniref:Uncharacterized protein n=1 Tax=Colocasia esculenta TaxID=4460 RepID=A0A843WBH2_COLES|nr:hypothetical protein [Colocasia esculenta]
MVFGSERSSRDGSCLWRHQTLSEPLPPTSQSIPPPPTSQLPVTTKGMIFRDLQLTYQWERTEKIDREMLAHMSAMHRSWRSKQKKRETMTELMAPSSGVDAESHTPATPEEVFILFMGKD